MANVIKDRVKENSTTTGTGNFTLSGAPLGFRAFSTVCSVGDTFRYAIQSVDTNGAPSGGWEVGIGTYSSANTLTRSTVIDSSNAGSVVDFSSGDKEVWIGMDAAMAAWPRERLTAARTYYVRTDGSDSNDGLADTSGGAFLTIGKAMTTVSGLDLSGYVVTVKVGDGTYTAAVTLPILIGGTAVLEGNTTTPANCVISTTSANAVTCSRAPGWTIKGFKIQTTTSGIGMVVNEFCRLTFQSMNFGACATAHMYTDSGGSIYASGNYTISGNSPLHMQMTAGGSFLASSITVTVSGTPAFSTAFAYATTNATITAYLITYSGSATGKRYDSTLNAVINTFGGGASYFPGNASGTTATGGQYA